MNFKLLILLSLFVCYTLSASSCAMQSTCNLCQAAGCDYCDETGFFFQCKDTGTCAMGATITAAGNCTAVCGDHKKCTDCQADTGLGCAYCSISGFGSCMTGPCAAPYVDVPVCPKICEAPPAPNAGNLCNLPAGYMIPANESFPYNFKACYEGGLGFALPTNATPSNCSDQCTVEYQTLLTSSCKSALLKLSCAATCPSCDADFNAIDMLKYFPCKSLCDDAMSACNTGLSDPCKFDLTYCSTDAKCNAGTGITANEPTAVKDCVTEQTSAVQTSAAQTSAVQTGSQQPTGTATVQTGSQQQSTGAQKSTAVTSQKTSSSSTTGNAASIVVCMIGFVALLI